MSAGKYSKIGMAALAVLILCVVCVLITDITKTVSATANPPASYILIDAGHGGVDGGASADDGTLEKDINLSIAHRVRDMLQTFGYTVRMTRDADTAVEKQDETIRSWKVRDMYYRLSMYDEAALTVSIHQNRFSQSQYNGTQIFYSTAAPESADIAACIRAQVMDLLQPQNKRETKPATDSIFLLYRTQRPAVLVECGFLSNPTEAAKLQTEEYQQQMAFAICCGIIEYFS